MRLRPPQPWLQWGLALGTVAVSVLLYALGRGLPLLPGQTATFEFTVVPADAVELECAADQSLGGHHCAYDARVQPQSGTGQLRPFITLSREVVLLSGVFESEGVNHWLNRAHQTGSLARVTLACRARLLGTLPQVSVRWARESDFYTESGPLAANVDDCVVKR